MADAKDIIRQYAGDMISLGKYIRDAADSQIDDDEFEGEPLAIELVSRLKRTMDEHITSLERHMEVMGDGSTGGIKKAAMSAMGSVVEMFQSIRSEDKSKMLRDHFTALSLAAISYNMLQTTALTLGDRSLADLCMRNVRQIPPLLVEINEMMPTLVARELREEIDTMSPAAVDEAIRNAQEIWGRSPARTGTGGRMI